MIIDKSLCLPETAGLLEIMAPYIAHWKMGFGTAAFWPEEILRTKIELVKSHGISIYPGGTLFESHVQHGKMNEFLSLAKKLGFNAVEISDGSLEIKPDVRGAAIEAAKKLGLTVIAEVGKKDPSQQLSPEQTLRQLEADFSSGADFVVIEARESGKAVGIFDEKGEVKTDYFKRLTEGISTSVLPRIIWEAPQKEQQVFLLRTLGFNVGLGNLRHDELLATEALRNGMRWETFDAR